MAKKQSLTEKNEQELIALLSKGREELRHLRFASAGSRPKDSAAPKKTRKDIARILTELHFRTIATPVVEEVKETAAAE